MGYPSQHHAINFSKPGTGSPPDSPYNNERSQIPRFIELLMHAVKVQNDVQPYNKFYVVMDGVRFHWGTHINSEQFWQHWQLRFLNPVEDRGEAAALRLRSATVDGQPKIHLQLSTNDALCCYNILLRWHQQNVQDADVAFHSVLHCWWSYCLTSASWAAADWILWFTENAALRLTRVNESCLTFTQAHEG
jgi:hypothetical protein